jgi:ribosomal protein S18 acetylase RimI-like enzyme
LFVGTQQILNEKGRIHLNEIAVSKDYQHKGVGTKLLNAVESSSFDLGADTIELFCNEDNEVAKKFYENNKYRTEKRLLIKKV